MEVLPGNSVSKFLEKRLRSPRPISWHSNFFCRIAQGISPIKTNAQLCDSPKFSNKELKNIILIASNNEHKIRVIELLHEQANNEVFPKVSD